METVIIHIHGTRFEYACSLIISEESTIENVEREIDISSIADLQHIAAWAQAGGGNDSTELKVYEIWLEK